MSNGHPWPLEDPAYIETIRTRRMQTLLGVWHILVKKGWLDPAKLKFSHCLAVETVEHYVTEMLTLKYRYRIEDLIQVPKIAGLMTEAIVRIRPIVPLVDECEDENQMLANEMVAIINGIAICGEEAVKEGDLILTAEPWFDGWFKNFLFLLHHRNSTSESLNFIYETLCWFRFPKSMEMPGKQIASTGE